MSAYTNEVRRYVERYQKEVRSDGLIDTREIAAWAYENGLHKPNLKTVLDVIAADISQVFREEYRTMPDGKRYRAKHAARQPGTKSEYLWADMDDEQAPHDHFVASFSQKRQQIVSECFQLKTDADVYNEKNPDRIPIQVPLDFAVDVEELQLPFSGKKAA